MPKNKIIFNRLWQLFTFGLNIFIILSKPLNGKKPAKHVPLYLCQSKVSKCKCSPVGPSAEMLYNSAQISFKFGNSWSQKQGCEDDYVAPSGEHAK